MWKATLAATACLLAAIEMPTCAAERGRIEEIRERLENANRWRDHVMVVAHRGGGLAQGATLFPENSVAAVGIAATGGILMRDRRSEADVPDTQTATFDFPGLQLVWTQRNWGANPEPDFPWGATLYGDRGTLKLSVQGYDFIPQGEGQPVHADYVDERAKYPEDTQHKETELFAASATRQRSRRAVRYCGVPTPSATSASSTRLISA